MRSRGLLFALFAMTLGAVAQEAMRGEPIDLPTVLKLAGAQGIDVEIAEAKLREARAAADGTTWALFPTISPGIGYRNHTGQAQSFAGPVSALNKESVNAGATLFLSLDLGEAVYRRLAAKQTAQAAAHGLAAQRQQTVMQATLAYFDLTKSHHAVTLLDDSVKVSKDYHAQIGKAVQLGLAFKGDEIRAFAQVSRLELRLSQAKDQRRADAARLAQLLRLKITEGLMPADDRPLPLSLVDGRRKLDELVKGALANRPELMEAGALHDAAHHQDDAAKYAPLYPTLGAQVFAGGLGGSTSSARRDFANSTDTYVTLSWKFGAGGIFDSSRTAGAEARLRQSQLAETKTRDEVVRQVVEAQSHITYLGQQLKITEDGIRSAEQGYKLSLGRQQFAVGIVLEALQSQQDLIQARLDYAMTVGELNKAQVRLKTAAGE
jgi:outer membrane protein TolC